MRGYLRGQRHGAKADAAESNGHLAANWEEQFSLARAFREKKAQEREKEAAKQGRAEGREDKWPEGPPDKMTTALGGEKCRKNDGHMQSIPN